MVKGLGTLVFGVFRVYGVKGLGVMFYVLRVRQFRGYGIEGLGV